MYRHSIGPVLHLLSTICLDPCELTKGVNLAPVYGKLESESEKPFKIAPSTSLYDVHMINKHLLGSFFKLVD